MMIHQTLSGDYKGFGEAIKKHKVEKTKKTLKTPHEKVVHNFLECGKTGCELAMVICGTSTQASHLEHPQQHQLCGVQEPRRSPQGEVSWAQKQESSKEDLGPQNCY